MISIQAPEFRQFALISDFLDLANLSIRKEAALATNWIKDRLEGLKLFAGEELKPFQSVTARFNFLAMDRPDLLYSVMRKMASLRTQDLTALKRVARYTIKYARVTCRYPWTELDSNIEVFGELPLARLAPRVPFLNAQQEHQCPASRCCRPHRPWAERVPRNQDGSVQHRCPARP